MKTTATLFFFLLANLLTAQQYYPQWGRVLQHGGDGPNINGNAFWARACILDDTTAVLATSGLNAADSLEWRIYLMSRAGNILFDSVYLPGFVRGIASISPDSFVVVGDLALVGQPKAFAALLNRSGDLLWEKTFDGSLEDSFEDVVLGNDQSIVIAGSSKSADGDFSSNHGGNDVWIFKLDYQGNILTSTNYGHAANEKQPKITQALGNMGYVVSANSDSSAFGHYLFSVDESGTVLWEKTFAYVNNAKNITRSESAQAYYISQINKTTYNEQILRVNGTGDSLAQASLRTYRSSGPLDVNSKGEVFIGAQSTNKDTLEAQFGELWMTYAWSDNAPVIMRFDSSLSSRQISLIHSGRYSYVENGGGIHLWNDSTIFFSSVSYTGTTVSGRSHLPECYLFTPSLPYTPDTTISSGLTKKALFLGTSLTFENGYSSLEGGIPNIINHIARAVGDSLSWDGLGISDFFYNILPSDPIYNQVATENYDYVSLQSVTYESWHPSYPVTDSGFYATSLPALQHISDTIFQINPCTQPLVYMVWGDYLLDNDFETTFRRYDKLRSHTNLGISPAAKVFDEINKRYPYNLLVRWADGYHPLVEGSFATALTMYTMMYHRDPLLVPNNIHITAEAFDIITSVVKEFVYDSLSKWGTNVHNLPLADFDYVQQGDSILIQNNALNYNTISWFVNGVEQMPHVVTPVFVQDSVQLYEITVSIQNECLSDSASHTVYIYPVQVSETPSEKRDELRLLTLAENVFTIQAPFAVAQVTAHTVLGQKVPLMVRGIGSEQVTFQIPGFIHEEIIVLSIWDKNEPNQPHSRVLYAK